MTTITNINELLASAIQMDAFKSEERAEYANLMIRRNAAFRALAGNGSDAPWFAALERNDFDPKAAVEELSREVEFLEQRITNAEVSEGRMKCLKAEVTEALGPVMQHFASVQISLDQTINRIEGAHRSAKQRREEHENYLVSQGLPREVAAEHAKPTADDVEKMLDGLDEQRKAAETVRLIRSSVERTARAAFEAWLEGPQVVERLPKASDFVRKAQEARND